MSFIGEIAFYVLSSISAFLFELLCASNNFIEKRAVFPLTLAVWRCAAASRFFFKGETL